MARGRQYGEYTTDPGTDYATLVPNNRFADGNFSWSTPAAGTDLVPRGIDMRKVHGVSLTTGRTATAIVPKVSAAIWTGSASTFDAYGNDGTLDTYTVTTAVGERRTRSH